MDTMNIIANSQLSKNDGDNIIDANINGKNIIGLYFSASYCPPCKVLTGILIDKYDELCRLCPYFEIILVPSDKSAEDRAKYFSTMLWLSIDYKSAGELRKKLKVTSLPTLLFIDADGNPIDYCGRALVENKNPKDIIDSLTSF